MSEKTPLPFNGPEPLHLPRATRPPEYAGPSKRPSGVHRLDGKVEKKTSRNKLYIAIATGLATVLGGGKMVQAQGQSQETKNAEMVKDLKQHTKDIDRLDGGLVDVAKRLGKVERKQAAMSAEDRIYHQLILEKLGVPKSKQPKPVEPEEDE